MHLGAFTSACGRKEKNCWFELWTNVWIGEPWLTEGTPSPCHLQSWGAGPCSVSYPKHMQHPRRNPHSLFAFLLFQTCMVHCSVTYMIRKQQLSVYSNPKIVWDKKGGTTNFPCWLGWYTRNNKRQSKKGQERSLKAISWISSAIRPLLTKHSSHSWFEISVLKKMHGKIFFIWSSDFRKRNVR